LKGDLQSYTLSIWSYKLCLSHCYAGKSERVAFFSVLNHKNTQLEINSEYFMKSQAATADKFP